MVDVMSYWYLFPIGIAIAVIYSSTGISGANFWAPIYLLWLKLNIFIGFWLALFTMLFGSMSGLLGHTRNKTINYRTVRRYLIFTIPFAILGAIALNFTNPGYAVAIFGAVITVYAGVVFYELTQNEKRHPNTHNTIRYLLGAIGAFFTGFISVGLGKLIFRQYFIRKQIRYHAEAAGSAMLIVFITSLVAVVVKLNTTFLSTLSTYFDVVESVLLYAIPGTIIGGFVGPWLSLKVDVKYIQILAALLLFLIGILMVSRALFIL